MSLAIQRTDFPFHIEFEALVKMNETPISMYYIFNQIYSMFLWQYSCHNNMLYSHFSCSCVSNELKDIQFIETFIITLKEKKN